MQIWELIYRIGNLKATRDLHRQLGNDKIADDIQEQIDKLQT